MIELFHINGLKINAPLSVIDANVFFMNVVIIITVSGHDVSGCVRLLAGSVHNLKVFIHERTLPAWQVINLPERGIYLIVDIKQSESVDITFENPPPVVMRTLPPDWQATSGCSS